VTEAQAMLQTRNGGPAPVGSAHRTPVASYRKVALSAVAPAIYVGIASLLILVLLPLAVAAQAASR
jgi:hypothetical protein